MTQPLTKILIIVHIDGIFTEPADNEIAGQK